LYSNIRRSRVIGDWGGYRRLIVDFALFGREGLEGKDLPASVPVMGAA